MPAVPIPPGLTATASATVELRGPLRLPSRSHDTTRGDRERVVRLVHLDRKPAVLEARHLGGALALTAHARDERTATAALARARFWSWVDDDLTPFLERFADDRLIGASIASAPWLRPYRRPVPFEVLACAVCEQLITDERAQEIQRELVRHHGPALGELRDFPDAATVAGLAPAELQRCGLAAKRATSLIRAAREVASGRADLLDTATPERAWTRLRSIPGVGAWTLSILALHGQGHVDALPAGDHAYRTLVGEVRTGRPGAAAGEEDVLEFLAPYAGWRGVAGWHLLRTGARELRAALGAPPRRPRAR